MELEVVSYEGCIPISPIRLVDREEGINWNWSP